MPAELRPKKHGTLRPGLRVLGALFVATGFAALLAEQCFEKLLGKLLGASTPAAAIVLSVYFFGLSIGGASYARLRRAHPRRAHPLRLYAALEAAVALWSLLLLVGTDASVRVLAPVLRLGVGHFWALEALRGAIACLWILPPTFLMGLSFPAVVEALEGARVPKPRRAIARFYTLNLVGAAAAAAAGPYVALPALGLGGTLGLTAVIDAAAAAGALALARGPLPFRPLPARLASATRGGTRSARTVLVLAFGSGFLLFSLEVLWTHLVAVTVGSSVYAFAAMLLWVLVGLMLGGALATTLFRDERPISASAVGVILLVGALLLAWQHGRWPGVSATFIAAGRFTGRFAVAEIVRALVAAYLILPPATALGMIYPALFRLRELPTEERAPTIARMGAFNAVGCLSGALVTGFALVPALGSEATSRLLGAATCVLGVLLVVVVAQGRPRGALAIALAGGACVFFVLPRWDRLGLIGGGNVYFEKNQVDDDSSLVFFHEDTMGGVTSVISGPDGPRTLLTNGKFQANDGSEVTAQEAFAMVPVLVAPRLESALVIGLGSGYSAHVLHDLGFGSLDVADLSPGILKASREVFGDFNRHVPDAPNVHVTLEDGRNHLLLTDRRYDVISMEITSVWFAGATSVYSREFYEAARDHLQAGGILQQWVQLHHLTMDEIGSILATLRSVFAHVELYVQGGQGIVIASAEPLAVRAVGVAAFYAYPRPPDRSADDALAGIFRARLLASGDVARLVKGNDWVVNTDWNRYLEYATPRYATVRHDFMTENIVALRSAGPTAPLDAEPAVPERVRALVAQPSPAP